MSKNIIFTGGGTTGHVTKNIIVIKALRKMRPELKVHYLGSKKGKESELIKSDLAKLHPICSGKLRRYFSLQTIPDFFRFICGIWQSFWLLGKIKPKLVFSSGGYVALPVAIAAWMRKIPVITHETDSYPGLANRIIARIAVKVLLGYESAKTYFNRSKVKYTGNPVSPTLLAGSKQKALKKLGFKDDEPIVMIMGGSQGAQQINELVAEILPELVKKYQVLHLTGKNKTQNSKFKIQNYVAYEYVTDDYADFLMEADLVISRGGGNSLAEIEALGKTAIVIPLLSAAGDHQRKNAREMQKKHQDWIVLDDEELKAEELLKAIKKLNPQVTKDKEDRSKVQEETIRVIMGEILEVLDK